VKATKKIKNSYKRNQRRPPSKKKKERKKKPKPEEHRKACHSTSTALLKSYKKIQIITPELVARVSHNFF
jgi:hypothetical protein